MLVDISFIGPMLGVGVMPNVGLTLVVGVI